MKKGIIIKRMWDDPNVADEDIPCVKFTFDSNLAIHTE
jgi:hypothetical protein